MVRSMLKAILVVVGIWHGPVMGAKGRLHPSWRCNWVGDNPKVLTLEYLAECDKSKDRPKAEKQLRDHQQILGTVRCVGKTNPDAVFYTTVGCRLLEGKIPSAEDCCNMEVPRVRWETASRIYEFAEEGALGRFLERQKGSDSDAKAETSGHAK